MQAQDFVKVQDKVAEIAGVETAQPFLIGEVNVARLALREVSILTGVMLAGVMAGPSNAG